MLHAHWIQNAQGKLIQTWEPETVLKQISNAGISTNKTYRAVCGKCKELVNS